MKKSLFFIFLFITSVSVHSQSVLKSMKRLPDTGQNTSYTNTFGEDNDFNINVPYFILNGDGTVTDTITGLLWQQTDGGEMTIENAQLYCDTLTLGGYNDWRLPTAHESFSILNHQHSNPALDNAVFTTTTAEYWWSSTRQANDSTRVWVTNKGGGIGNHLKTETVSAGGTRIITVRAVRDITPPPTIPNHFTDNGNGTVTDNLTNLIWQKVPYSDTLTWEQALAYADTLSLAGYSDWRLPNIKELQSINDEGLINPSINTNYFSVTTGNKYWSSTTLPNQTTKVWYLYTQYGITTYDEKTLKHYLICVRGNTTLTGIETAGNTSVIKIYPNPASSEINIIFNQNNNSLSKHIEISNQFGQVVFKHDINSATNSYRLITSEYANGLYLLSVTENNVLRTFRISISR